jgi:aminomethyltransferase
MVPAGDAARIWRALSDAGAVPCGLGARDVLRLEAGLPLHGNDIDSGTNPYEAGLGRFVDVDRDEYVARESLIRLRDEVPARRLVGFDVVGRGIARQGYAIIAGDERVGEVTSGSYSPTLDRAIGMGYVREDLSDPGTPLHVDVRGRLVEAEVTLLPFYAERQAPILAPIS